MRILVLNPGSSSTKIAVYEDTRQLWQEDVKHDTNALLGYPTIFSQIPYRLPIVLETLEKHGQPLEGLACVMSRGGLLPPVSSGAYEVNDEMLDVLEHRPMNHHASNLGAAIALKIARPLGIKAYIYDPVTVDEMTDVVRITGLKEIRRYGQGHNLNMRSMAIRYCLENGLDYREKNIVVAHMGGGITLTLHSKGRIIDMISDDEGPFSPERAGLIPDFRLAKYISENNLSYKDTMFILQREGGLTSLCGSADAKEVIERMNSGDKEAALAIEAMALGVAQSIARLSVDVNGKVDAVILTGGIAYSGQFTDMVTERVSFIAPVVVMPGENEMQALADGAYRVLTGIETAREYSEPADRPYA
ncbi:MAG: butyrate kinase [Eubacteriaceae bacterium]|nr:butyrate kinase [Eubacteriaceae bacterium]MBR5995960.1 butyrate kinase [Eubacteriaceae bacterium]